MFEDMESQLQKQFKADKIKEKNIKFFYFADIRYVGQGYELRIKIENRNFDLSAEKKLFKEFDKKHHKEYGRSFPNSSKEIVNVRITGIGKSTKLEKQIPLQSRLDDDSLLKFTKCIFRFKSKLKTFKTAIYVRKKIPIDKKIDGPAIILQHDTTTIVRPNDSFFIDKKGNMIISINP